MLKLVIIALYLSEGSDMNNFCPQCGAPVERQARFCGRCGRPVSGAPVEQSPPTAAPRRRTGLVGRLLAGLIAFGMCLCLVAGGAIFFRAGGGTIPGLDTLLPSSPLAEAQIDAQTLQQLEQSIDQLEAAFRSGDLKTVIDLTHPAMRADYQAIFEAHQAELARVADLLATRRLVHATYGMAEYEVTENGRTFSVILEPWGQQWYLSSL
jgi:hypothetical protein